jgi:hypothetical protein
MANEVSSRYSPKVEMVLARYVIAGARHQLFGGKFLEDPASYQPVGGVIIC